MATVLDRPKRAYHLTAEGLEKKRRVFQRKAAARLAQHRRRRLRSRDAGLPPMEIGG